MALPQHFEHTIQFDIEVPPITFWATFYRIDGSQVKLYSGAKIVSASTQSGGKSTITTEKDHGLALGMTVYIDQVEGSTPAISGSYTVEAPVTATTFRITENVTVAGARGYCGRLMPHYVLATGIKCIGVGRFDDQSEARGQSYYL